MAGVLKLAPIVDMLDEVWDKMTDVNIKGTFVVTLGYVHEP